MLSINTNLSSLIAQNSMSSATKLLNQAVERMTTGYKINHSKDNAANYSISEKMNMQISSFDVAADNVAMGMDLVTTASDIISNMQDKASRLQALCTQARNGTYGQQSMHAINSEAAAIMAEINRLYNTAEYNNVSLFNRKAYEIADHLPQAGENGFIEQPVATFAMRAAATPSAPVAKEEYNGFIEDPKTYTDEEVAAMTKVADVSTFTSGEKYSISTVEELQKLADYVNAGNDTTGVEFVLGADIDLSSISNWTPIGDYSTSSSYQFKGTFDGNGHTIKNLTIDNETEYYQGLFGRTASGSVIKNIGLEGGEVKGSSNTGSLVGCSYSTITNSYATGDVIGKTFVGGLVGDAFSGSISNSYATCDVKGSGSNVGGLVGVARSGSLSNCYATGDVLGSSYQVGGLVGWSGSGTTISNSYATGDVTSSGHYVGGLVGKSGTISNSYATGNVLGSSYGTGGLVGYSSSSISNSYAMGDVTGDTFVGGLVGEMYKTSGSLMIDSNAFYGKVSGTDLTSTGSLIGGIVNTSNGTTFGTVNVSNCQTITQEGINSIGGCFKTDNTAMDYDMTTMLAGVSDVEFKGILTSLQVGINSDSSCQIEFDINFQYDLSSLEGDIASDEAFGAITDFINLLSERSTYLGAIENRLQSAIESIEVNIENLTSSLSTIRDADIAEVSSEYIRQQILQQASATLLSTANQSPSIALQLI